MKQYFKHLGADLPASLVVFLVALPLCLGIGLASTTVEGVDGMPNIFSGLIAGIVGGIIVGALSGSRIGVSGPAAGLITIVTAAIVTLGSFQAFLVAVVIGGIFQIIAGYAKLGILGNYFPSSVIKGMLAGIGITLIQKQIPHALGCDKDFFGDLSFWQMDGENTYTEIGKAAMGPEMGAVIITLVSLAILILFNRPFMKKIALFKILPGALFVVLIGVFLNLIFQNSFPSLTLGSTHLVELPIAHSIQEFTSFFTFPDFSYLTDFNVYIIGGTIALVGSLETLLSVEATDNLDPNKHHTPTNRELKAQGVGNIVSGMIGGLPITQVIVRSSANANAGGRSKVSAIVHGFLLLLCLIFIPRLINHIPLSALAAILIMVGYKLTRIGLFKKMYRDGWEQFIPFVATVLGVVLSNLLMGIGIGIVFAIFFILRRNFRHNYSITTEEKGEKTLIKMTLAEEVTFLNKASIVQYFYDAPENVTMIIDGTDCKSINHDVLESIQDFKDFGAPEKNIELTVIDIPSIKLN
ncbi:MAG: SulP family inorganic anion transporter [Crocinitomicaceae bacterium]|nr:SulP family inorganic anion transporter [Crocinitomicaceae bacterium]